MSLHPNRFATAAELADIFEGKLGKEVEPDELVERFALKAFNIGRNDLFLPLLPGADKKYFRAVARGGISLLTPEHRKQTERSIIVDNVDAAVDRLARFRREEFKGEIVGVTGSAGKSTTKTMLHTVLKNDCSVFSTMANQNLTTFTRGSLCALTNYFEKAVFEVAMFDEQTVRESSKFLRPHIGIVASIGMNHAGNLDGTVEAVIDAKTQMFNYLDGRGVVILPSHDDHFDALFKKAEASSAVHDICTVGFNENDYVQLIDYEEGATGSNVRIRVEQEEVSFHVSQPGYHFVLNTLLVAAAINKMGLDINLIKHLKDYQTPNSSIVRYRIDLVDGKTFELFDDAIISSPHQVSALLEILKKRKSVKRKVLFFGDMTALGEKSQELHDELVPQIDEAGFDLVVTIGEFSNAMGQKLSSPTMAFADSAEAANHILGLIEHGDLVAIKGSGPTKLKLLLKKIYSEGKRSYAKDWTIEGL